MEPITVAWAAEAMGARIVGAAEGVIRGVCTDTRRDADDSLFFALPGENSDGHAYVARAFAAGAVGAVVSQDMPDAPGPLLVVPDTLRALGDLAQHYRRQFAIPVVGVTGSVGKTSTKEMIAAVLRAKYNTLASEKNYNNEIGVPLTLFQLTRAHEAAVIEMGMRGLGEIDRLAEIAQPTVGVITNIGHAHIERLGSRQQIAQAKSELLARLPAGGTAVLPRDDEFYDYLLSRVPEGCHVLKFAKSGCSIPDTYCCFRNPDKSMYANEILAPPAPSDAAVLAPGSGGILGESIPTRDWFPPNLGGEGGAIGPFQTLSDMDDSSVQIAPDARWYAISLRVVGKYHYVNAAAALAVGAALDVPIPEAIAALEQWQGAEGRMTIRKTSDGLTVLDDCYNAGPESMAAALQTLATLSLFQLNVAVLGDMKELGDFSPEAHRRVGRAVVDYHIRLLITVGELAVEIADETRRYAESCGKAAPIHYHCSDSDEAAARSREILQAEMVALEEEWQPRAVVLVKGSRAMQMEKIVAALTGETGGDAHG